MGEALIPTQESLEQALGVQILDLYRQSIFGKVAKAEIDLKVFATLTRLSFRQEACL